MLVGLDVGSTTTKVYAMHEDMTEAWWGYRRHGACQTASVRAMLGELAERFPHESLRVAVTGSGARDIATALGASYVQEVVANALAISRFYPQTRCAIELGGQDAKMIFFRANETPGALDVADMRMNGSCAGGTGAFIDQMATLLNITVDELDKLSLNAGRLYPIASRCGVFAKTDIQPLLNQGARKEDVAASIYQAVVNQTIAGLAQGRKIDGKVLFLGGPLYYCKGLRTRFKETLKLDDEHAVFPEYARFAVALGASYYAEQQPEIFTADELLSLVENAANVSSGKGRLKPLFRNEEEYNEFKHRHAASSVKNADIEKYSGKAYLGIDCGSTTTKLCLLGENNEILYSYYASNQGNPVEIVREQLTEIYKKCGYRVTIAGSAVTGYGEDLIKAGLGVDFGIVETVAHYKAAAFFCPDVDFIIDIGWQDI